MKKGLRRATAKEFVIPVDSNQRPDEEGIKTASDRRLRRYGMDSNQRPDEEGIKTTRAIPFRSAGGIQTRDLMKKGLRRAHHDDAILESHSNQRPDEEGIKTVLGEILDTGREIQTRDLMKKGLRRQVLLVLQGRQEFKPET